MVGFFRNTLFIASYILLLSACNKPDGQILYESKNLLIKQLEEDVFVHISYLNTDDFGKVRCNGAIFKNEDEVIILDTPTNDIASNELLKWVKEFLNSKVIAVVPTHAHEDCLGGIGSFHKTGIKSYAHSKTIQAAKLDSIYLKSESFDDALELEFGGKNVLISFLGRGHTQDNVVAYYPDAKALFGGCLVKSVGAKKGYLGDADTTTWSATMKTIKSTYPRVELVIPGHGKPGDSKLLDYTANLFDQDIN